jgi:hypothetical protein
LRNFRTALALRRSLFWRAIFWRFFSPIVAVPSDLKRQTH